MALKARWVVGHGAGGHRLYSNGTVVVAGDRIESVGTAPPPEGVPITDFGDAVLSPGFIDLDALADLDTTVLAYCNQPPERTGRVWPLSYIQAGPREMYTPDELTFQKRYAFARLLQNGITTALPIASLFYREWGETFDEFARAAESAADLGIRVYLGPAYRTGNAYFDEARGETRLHFDEERGLRGLDEAMRFCREYEGTANGLVRTMLAPDRIETCTPDILRRTAGAARDLGVPVRLHCAQSNFEYRTMRRLHGKSPIALLADLGFLSERTLLPHGVFLSGTNGLPADFPDLDLLAETGATVVHCPLVMARSGRLMDSFRRLRERGIRIGLGTDTHPPDMIQNMSMGVIAARMADRDPVAATAADLFDAATIGGADAIGRPDLGRLEPGAAADLIVVRLDNPEIGQRIDPIQTILLNASGRDISHVMVAGRFVMQDRRIKGVDPAEMHRTAQAQFDALLAQYPDRTTGHPPLEEIFPPSYPSFS